VRRWLILEPYYGGSHRQLVDGIVDRIGGDPVVWTLPARKWKWRMRGASLAFARRADEEKPEIDAVFASSMVNLAEWRGIVPPALRDLPVTVYFHENQLAYPVQHFDRRDHHFAWSNVHTALAADRVLWNSAFNRDSFLHALRGLVRKMPDARPEWVADAISARSEVLPVPIDVAAIERVRTGVPPRSGPCHIVWNHRWEFDKGPDLLLGAVRILVASGLPFTMSVLGQSFREGPDEFAVIRELLGDRARHFGFLPGREPYLKCLASADVALSTARHEFQGLAVLEAAAAGAVPLVPDRLAYPEIWPEAWRWADEAALARLLLDRVRGVESWRKTDPWSISAHFGWGRLGERWAEILQ
jgi:glycosyltransferase involved in cell wall biosynthesis